MSTDDRDLRAALDRRASTVTTTPDWDDLTTRMVGRDRRRTRALAGALVLSLFAGPMLGFVAGRGAADAVSETNVRADARAKQSADDTGADGTGGEVRVARPSALPVVPRSASTETLARPSGPSDMLGFIPAPMAPYYGGEPLARAFDREANGARAVVYWAAIEPYNMGVPWWEPAKWCYPSRMIQADVSTPDAVGIGTGHGFDELPPGDVAATLNVMGLAEGAPTWIVVAQVPPGTALVRATFPGGVSDSMDPVEGFAVLVGRASMPSGDNPYDDLAQQETSVVALDASGSVIAERQVGFGSSGYAGPDLGSQDCMPPSELPAPGPEQPADVDAARAAVVAAYETVYNGANTEDVRAASIDDPSGLDVMFQELLAGPFAQQVKDARVTDLEVVFTSADRAAVRYTIDIPNYSVFGPQFGEATLVDGQWKVTRDTICKDVRLAGVTCP